MTYEVAVESGFTARHGIRLPDGTVEPGHTHDWRVTVRFTGTELDECGLLVDFEAIKAELKEILASLEGTNLNANPALRGMNPTAECVAKVILEAMLERRATDPRLVAVQVMEAPGCLAVCLRP
jgi:6-pyruvoyltetrahydropterin/6-carboxytetrahydropterin synthase